MSEDVLHVVSLFQSLRIYRPKNGERSGREVKILLCEISKPRV